MHFSIVTDVGFGNTGERPAIPGQLFPAEEYQVSFQISSCLVATSCLVEASVDTLAPTSPKTICKILDLSLLPAVKVCLAEISRSGFQTLGLLREQGAWSKNLWHVWVSRNWH